MNQVSDHLLRLEKELLDPAVRRDRGRVERLLAINFEELGSSGRSWNREETLDLLATEPERIIEADEFRCSLVAETVALITYRTVRTDPKTGIRRTALRSSLWIREADGWRMRFHQGTLTP